MQIITIFCFLLSVYPLGSYLDRSTRECDLHPVGGVHCGLKKENGNEEIGSDHSHNRVSTYARITIIIVFKRGMIMVLCHCSDVVRTSINVWLC